MNTLTATHVGAGPRTRPWEIYVCERCGREVKKSRAVPSGICGDCKHVDGEFWESR